MTAPAAPAFRHADGPTKGAAFTAVYGLLLRGVATRGRIIGVSVLAGLLVLAGVVTSSVHPEDPVGAATGYANASLTTVVPVAVLVFGAGTLGDLIDDGTLVYLWLRPVPSWVHVAAAWAATVTIALPLAALPTVLAATVISTDGGVVVGTAVASVVAVAAYAALFVTGGVRFRRALPWGLAYILIWEGFVAVAGKTASKLAIRSYVRSILSVETGVRIKLARFTLASGIIVPLVIGVVALLYASRRLAKTDVP